MEEQPDLPPHSKTTVPHLPWKTRLHCNHLQPKCRCSATSNRKRSAKQNQSKPGPVRAPKQILVSSRRLPRGIEGGRKHYPESGDDPPTVLSGSWQPQGPTSGRGIIKPCTRNKTTVDKIGGDISTTAGTNNAKKKVHFAGKHSSETRNEGEDHSLRKKQPPSQNSTSHDPYKESDSVSEAPDSDQESTNSQAAYCRLCETGRYSHTQSSLPSKHYPYSDSNRSSDSCPYSSQSSDVDCCHLCNTYSRKKHYYGDGESLAPRNPSHTPRSPSRTPPQEAPTTPKHRRSYLRRKTSAPEFSSSLNEPRERRIPYEPRTQLVRDLKQTLEAESAASSWVRGSSSSSKENRRPWVAEDLDSVYRPRLCHDLPDVNFSHKCVHRYQQNDRLFLEPTITNRWGESVCSECGAPQPQDPHMDPYLYHITLGGFKERSPSHSRADSRKNTPGKNPDNSTKTAPHVLKTKVLYDPSKHVFAKLKSNVDNVLPRSAEYAIDRGRTKPRVNPQFKRPPSNSMALVDHLV